MESGAGTIQFPPWAVAVRILVVHKALHKDLHKDV